MIQNQSLEGINVRGKFLFSIHETIGHFFNKICTKQFVSRLILVTKQSDTLVKVGYQAIRHFKYIFEYSEKWNKIRLS